MIMNKTILAAWLALSPTAAIAQNNPSLLTKETIDILNNVGLQIVEVCKDNWLPASECQNIIYNEGREMWDRSFKECMEIIKEEDMIQLIVCVNENIKDGLWESMQKMIKDINNSWLKS